MLESLERGLSRPLPRSMKFSLLSCNRVRPRPWTIFRVSYFSSRRRESFVSSLEVELRLRDLKTCSDNLNLRIHLYICIWILRRLVNYWASASSFFLFRFFLRLPSPKLLFPFHRCYGTFFGPINRNPLAIIVFSRIALKSEFIVEMEDRTDSKNRTNALGPEISEGTSSTNSNVIALPFSRKWHKISRATLAPRHKAMVSVWGR